MKRAIIAALNLCVPKKYRRVDGGIVAQNYKVNQCPRTILDHLQNLYGRPTPMENTMNEASWAAAYNPSKPIEDLYDRLEECFVVALVAKPAYTMDQMVEKALIAVQLTGLYATAILEWNVVDVMNQTCTKFKMHFTEAYDLRIHLGAGTAGTMGYHGANNATGADDESW